MLDLAIDRASTAGVERCWDRKGQVAAAFKPPKGDVRIYEHREASGLPGLGWDAFFGDGTHRAFAQRELAYAAAARWARAHDVYAWITKTKGTQWHRLRTGDTSD